VPAIHLSHSNGLTRFKNEPVYAKKETWVILEDNQERKEKQHNREKKPSHSKRDGRLSIFPECRRIRKIKDFDIGRNVVI